MATELTVGLPHGLEKSRATPAAIENRHRLPLTISGIDPRQSEDRHGISINWRIRVEHT
jgi:hypothetical protein